MKLCVYIQHPIVAETRSRERPNDIHFSTTREKTMTTKKFGLVVCLLAVLGLFFGLGPAQAGEGDDAGEASAFLQCPVMGEDINFATSFATDDGPIYVCCKGCFKKLKANPEKYATKVAAQREALAKMAKVQVKCPLCSESIDPTSFTEQDGEKVYTCSEKCAGQYKADPAKYKGALAGSYTYQTKCPVSGKAIDPTASTKLATGETVHFCCGGCIKKFTASPGSFVEALEKQHFSIDLEKLEKASKAG